MIVAQTTHGPVFIRHADVRVPEAQTAIDRSHSLHCLCTGSPGSPLYARGRPGEKHLARAPGTAARHLSGCPHSSEPNLAAALGAPRGSFAESDGHITVNFSALFRQDTSSGAGSGGGVCTAKGNPLLSLLYFLLVRAGLHIALPGIAQRDAFHELRVAAAQIHVIGGAKPATLADLLFTPMRGARDSGYVTEIRRDRLQRAAHQQLPVLTVSFVPWQENSQMAGGDLQLRNDLGPSTWLSRKSYLAALRAASRANSGFQPMNPALLFCLADVKKILANDEGRGLYAKVNRCVILPVSPTLLPLPTAQVAAAFEAANRAREVFAMRPAADPRLR